MLYQLSYRPWSWYKEGLLSHHNTGFANNR